MKKIILVLSVLFISISSSFAYDGGISLHVCPDHGDTQSGSVAVNRNCTEVDIVAMWTYNWAGSSCVGAHGSLYITDTQTGMGYAEFDWYNDTMYDYNDYQRVDYQWQCPTQYVYLGTINYYLYAYECYGQFTMRWSFAS